MDLPNISFMDKLSTRELVILVVTLLVVVGMGYYKFEWESLQKQREELANQVMQAEQSVQGFQAALGMVKPEKMQQEINKVKEEIETLKLEIDLTKGKMTEKVADIVRVLGDQAKFQKAQLVTLNSREKLVESVAEYDDVLLEKFFDNPESITTEELQNAIRKATIAMSITPLMCGSAFKNKGVQTLLDAVCEFLPSAICL